MAARGVRPEVTWFITSALGKKMTQKILGALVVLLAVSLGGVPMSHAQDNGRAEKGAKQKNENAQKNSGRKSDLEQQKLKDQQDRQLKRDQVRAERAQGKTERQERVKELNPGELKRVDGNPTMRDLRRASRRDGTPVQRGKMAAKFSKARHKQFDHELQKHAKRLATIDRLVEISEKNGNEKLGERAQVLRKKESARHARKLAQLKQVPVRMERVVKPKLQLERKKMNPNIHSEKADAVK